MSFYSPFLFGQVLSACRTELFHLTAARTLRFKTAAALAQVIGFIVFVTYFEAEGRYLSSFFFSSFLCPAIRHYAPERGDKYVYALVTVGLIGAWLYQGLDHLFFGIFFLQGVPEVQRQLWFEPLKNFSLISTVFLITAPFTTLGTVAYWRPEWLQSLPLWYLELLCVLMGVIVKDYHAVLGVPRDASKEAIGRQYRKMALTCHPDKIATASASERAALEGQFRDISEAQDMLNRPRNEGAKELNELIPRCAAAAFLCLYWIMHMLMDYLEIQQSIVQAEIKLRAHLRSNAPDGRPFAYSIINLKAIGLEGRSDELMDYLEDDNKFIQLPLCRENNLEDIKEMRSYLREAGIKLDPLPKGLPSTEPLIRQPPPQQQQMQQTPPWAVWLQQPAQSSNILAMSFKGEIERVEAALRGVGGPPQAPHATIQPGRRSCVFLAAMNGHARVVQILHQARADVRLPDEDGFSPLHVASAQGHQDAVECLLHCKADATQATDMNVYPLHTAAISGSVPIIKLLLRAGAKVKEKDKQGESALFCAAKSNKAEAVTCLLKSKADLEGVNIKNMTCLWIASACGHASAVATLHKAGAIIDKVAEGIEPPLNGKTAQEAAEICKKDAVVELLLAANPLREKVEVADRAVKRAKEDDKPKMVQSERLKELVAYNAEINNLYKEYITESTPVTPCWNTGS